MVPNMPQFKNLNGGIAMNMFSAKDSASDLTASRQRMHFNREHAHGDSEPGVSGDRDPLDLEESKERDQLMLPRAPVYNKKRKANEVEGGLLDISKMRARNRWGDSISPEDRAYGNFGGRGGIISTGNDGKVEVSRSALGP